jgi:hypothetical protein
MELNARVVRGNRRDDAQSFATYEFRAWDLNFRRHREAGPFSGKPSFCLLVHAENHFQPIAQFQCVDAGNVIRLSPSGILKFSRSRSSMLAWSVLESVD